MVTAGRLHRLGEGVFLKSFTSVFQVLVGAGLSVLLNRVYGKHDFGLLVLVYAVTGFTFATSDLGSKITLIRYVPLWMQQQREADAARLFAAALVIQLAGIAVLGGGILLGARLIAERLFQQPALLPLIHLGVVYIASFALFDFFVQTFQALQNWRREGTLNVLFGALQVIAATIVGVLLHAPIRWVLVGHAGAGLATVAVGLAWLPREFRRALWNARPGTIREGATIVATFGLPLMFQGVYRFGVSWFDKLMLGRFGSPSELAVYYIASSFLNALISLFKVLPIIFAPYVSEISGAGAAAVQRQFTLIFRWFVQVVVIVSLVVFFAVEPVVAILYGRSYEAVVPLTRALLIVFALRACRDPFGLFLMNAFNMVRTVFIMGTVLTVATFVFTAGLVPFYGVWGAVAATIASQTITWIVLLVLAPQLRVMVPARSVWTTAVVVGVVGALYALLQRAPIPHVVLGGTLVGLYLVVLTWRREIGPEELRIAREIFYANKTLLVRAAGRVA